VLSDFVDTEEVQAVEEETPVQSGSMQVEDALKEVLKTALVHNGLIRGLRQVAKVLDR
jgi:small subunit ribosomal protein S12e